MFVRKTYISIFIIMLSSLLYGQESVPKIDIKPLSSNLYKFSCGVNNWLILTVPNGVLLSDSGPESYALATKENLTDLGNNNIKYIINTHWHHDHTGGNILLGNGDAIIAHKKHRPEIT